MNIHNISTTATEFTFISPNAMHPSDLMLTSSSKFISFLHNTGLTLKKHIVINVTYEADGYYIVEHELTGLWTENKDPVKAELELVIKIESLYLDLKSYDKTELGDFALKCWAFLDDTIRDTN